MCSVEEGKGSMFLERGRGWNTASELRAENMRIQQLAGHADPALAVPRQPHWTALQGNVRRGADRPRGSTTSEGAEEAGSWRGVRSSQGLKHGEQGMFLVGDGRRRGRVMGEERACLQGCCP